jgi:hypothetical protein
MNKNNAFLTPCESHLMNDIQHHPNSPRIDKNIKINEGKNRSKPKISYLIRNKIPVFSSTNSLSTIEEESETEILSIHKNTKKKKNYSPSASVNLQLMNYSSSNDSLDSIKIIGTSDSNFSDKDDYNPCSSNSSRKGCYNYQCSESEIDEMDILKENTDEHINNESESESESDNKKMGTTTKSNTRNTRNINLLNKILGDDEDEDDDNDDNNLFINSTRENRITPIIKNTDKIMNTNEISNSNSNSIINQKNNNMGKKNRSMGTINPENKNNDINEKMENYNNTITDHSPTHCLIHRRIKIKKHSSSLNSSFSIPNRNPFDIDTEELAERDIIMESEITEEQDIKSDDPIIEKERISESAIGIPSIPYINYQKSLLNSHMRKGKENFF